MCYISNVKNAETLEQTEIRKTKKIVFCHAFAQKGFFSSLFKELNENPTECAFVLVLKEFSAPQMFFHYVFKFSIINYLLNVLDIFFIPQIKVPVRTLSTFWVSAIVGVNLFTGRGHKKVHKSCNYCSMWHISTSKRNLKLGNEFIIKIMHKLKKLQNCLHVLYGSFLYHLQRAVLLPLFVVQFHLVSENNLRFLLWKFLYSEPYLKWKHGSDLLLVPKYCAKGKTNKVMNILSWNSSDLHSISHPL